MTKRAAYLWCLFVVLALTLPWARADDSYYWQAFGGHTGPTALAACQSIDTAPGHKARVEGPGYWGDYTCYIDYPAGSTPPLTGYGSVVEHGTPPPPPPPGCADKNPYVVMFKMTAGSKYPTQAGGCNIKVQEVLVCRKQLISGAMTDICMLQVVRDGNLATYPDTQPAGVDTEVPSTPEDKTAVKIKQPPSTPDPGAGCPAGAVQGGIDSSGITICIGTGTQTDAPTKPTTTTTPPTTTTNADGSTSSTTSTTTTNSDGSQTTITTVTNIASDGTKTVTQTGTTTNNPAGTSGTPDGDSGGFCKENPTLSVCQNSSVSGSCQATTCTGDAIQCATLRAAATIQCTHDTEVKELASSDAVALGQQMAAGADPAAGTLPSPKNATAVTMPSIDNSGWLGGGSFFKDKTIAIPGYGSVVIPFSQAEGIFLVLRAVAMAFGALVSAKILRQTVIGG